MTAGRAWIDLWNTRKEFFSTTGSTIEQTLVQTGCGIEALAVGDGDAQDRTYPGDVGLYQSGGWEVVERARLGENAQRIGEEAIALLTAPQCPQGEMDVILGGSQVSLQIHESCGHAAELDRAMGWEANFSGVSFLDPALRYAAIRLRARHDRHRQHPTPAASPRSATTTKAPAASGRTSCATAFRRLRDVARHGATIGRKNNACVRAQSWEHVPMIRMCNLNLLPGSTPFEELFADVKRGVYMESNRSWSIDDHRLNFQFGCQIGWEIVDGKRGRMVKNPTYAGVTPRFWNSCDAVADERSWVAWGTPNCGKGEPMNGRTAQCASPARFRNVAVGVGYRG